MRVAMCFKSQSLQSLPDNSVHQTVICGVVTTPTLEVDRKEILPRHRKLESLHLRKHREDRDCCVQTDFGPMTMFDWLVTIKDLLQPTFNVHVRLL